METRDLAISYLRLAEVSRETLRMKQALSCNSIWAALASRSTLALTYCLPSEHNVSSSVRLLLVSLACYPVEKSHLHRRYPRIVCIFDLSVMPDCSWRHEVRRPDPCCENMGPLLALRPHTKTVSGLNSCPTTISMGKIDRLRVSH